MAWPVVHLREVIEQDQHYVCELEPVMYKKLSVKLYGRGVVLDKPVEGASVLMKKHQFARAGQIIVSEIWAKKGALGLVPREGEGALCTSHFYLFDIDAARLEPRWFHYLAVGNFLEPQIGEAAKGTTSYASVRPQRFLECKIPLPPINEQQRIVALLDRVAALVEEARRLREGADQDAAALTQRLHAHWSSDEVRPFGDFMELWEDREPVEPEGSYPQIGIKGFAGGLFTKAAVRGSETSYKAFNRLHVDLLVVSQPKGWEGAVAVCDEDVEGWFASPEYRTFRCRKGRLLPRYLDMLIRTQWFQAQLTQLTRGQGARRERLRPEMLLAMEVKMPNVDQQRTALRIIDHCRAIRNHHVGTATDFDSLIPAMLHKVFGGALEKPKAQAVTDDKAALRIRAMAG